MASSSLVAIPFDTGDWYWDVGFEVAVSVHLNVAYLQGRVGPRAIGNRTLFAPGAIPAAYRPSASTPVSVWPISGSGALLRYMSGRPEPDALHRAYPATVNPDGSLVFDDDFPQHADDPARGVWLDLAYVTWPVAAPGADPPDDGWQPLPVIGFGWENVDGEYVVHGNRAHLRGRVQLGDEQFPDSIFASGLVGAQPSDTNNEPLDGFVDLAVEAPFGPASADVFDGHLRFFGDGRGISGAEPFPVEAFPNWRPAPAGLVAGPEVSKRMDLGETGADYGTIECPVYSISGMGNEPLPDVVADHVVASIITQKAGLVFPKPAAGGAIVQETNKALVSDALALFSSQPDWVVIRFSLSGAGDSFGYRLVDNAGRPYCAFAGSAVTAAPQGNRSGVTTPGEGSTADIEFERLQSNSGGAIGGTDAAFSTLVSPSFAEARQYVRPGAADDDNVARYLWHSDDIAGLVLWARMTGAANFWLLTDSTYIELFGYWETRDHYLVAGEMISLDGAGWAVRMTPAGTVIADGYVSGARSKRNRVIGG